MWTNKCGKRWLHFHCHERISVTICVQNYFAMQRFIFFSHWRIILLLYSNIRISVLFMFGVNDQNQNRQQSCSKKSKYLPSSNTSSVRQNPLRWYQLCNRILQIKKKKKMLNNWVRNKKALKNVENTGHGVSQKSLKLANMPYDTELHQYGDISHWNIQE